MENSLLIATLREMDLRERKKIHAWIQSPQVNERAEVVRLYELIEKELRRPPYKLEKQRIFFAIFPQQAYDDLLLRRHMSYLLQAVKQWIAWQSWQNDGQLPSIHLIRGLRERNLTRLFQNEWRKSRHQIEKSPLPLATQLHQEYLLLQEKYELGQQKRLHPSDELEQLGQHLSAYCALSLLRHGLALLSQQRLTGASASAPPLLAEVLQQIEQGAFSGFPAIGLYYTCYRLLKEERENDFFQLKNMLLQFQPQLENSEARELLLQAVNYCIGRLNRGQEQFVDEALELYQLGLEHHTLLENGRLSVFTYHNITSLALARQKFEWTGRFIDEYRKHLPARRREQVHQYHLALLKFKRGRYEEAQLLLHGLRFPDLLFEYDARKMLLRIYYEQDEYDLLESHLDSFQSFIRRHKNSSYHFDHYRNLIRYTRRMMKLPQGADSRRAQLRREVEKTESVAERDWLLQQLT